MSRPTITLRVKLELWGRTAGRCEFRGCNKPIYCDDLTKRLSNLGRISHIIAYEPGGPRGNPVDSPRLAKDISNLILTCADHAKLVDDMDKVEDYPVELLCEYKREHENRIKILTDIQENAKTHVLIAQVPIRRQRTTIDKSEAYEAILPKYPASEDPLEIDLSVITLRESDDSYWDTMADEITRQVESIFREGRNTINIDHVSLFALAPIPLLVHLGFQLGSIKTLELFQRHRNPQDWIWREENTPDEDFYRSSAPDSKRRFKQVALSVSVSGAVPDDAVQQAMGQKPFAHYDLNASMPALTFLKSRERLYSFADVYRSALQEICSVHGHDCQIHLFSAVPAPVAVECGRSLLRGSYPSMAVYQFDKDDGYQYALTVNADDKS